MRVNKYLKGMNKVYHTTLDPNGPGACRIHLVPPKKLKAHIPWVVVLNGYSVLPIQSSWAILLKIFIENLNRYDKKTLSDEDIEALTKDVTSEMNVLFPSVEKQYFNDDLNDMILTFKDICAGVEPKAEIGYMTLAKYGKYMQAPHRMDLLVSAMEKNGSWNCNQKCLHCYACGQRLANTKELTTEEWFKIIDKLKDSCVPEITFTGGEPTIREDLPKLIKHADWFVTRLNTNGILLNKELCEELYNASLDSVQITFYSSDAIVHNSLVGGDHFNQTVTGIKNAIEAGLDVSINTPLCSLNKDYLKTIEYAYKLGVRYFSCSGLIPSGNALDDKSVATKLSREEILEVLKEAYSFTSKNNCEISFTSPGWISLNDLRRMHMVAPSCGACLSNMAISPDGEVIPCQSWLSEDSLGNALTTSFKKIWNSPKCKSIRKYSMDNIGVCQLKELNK